MTIIDPVDVKQLHSPDKAPGGLPQGLKLKRTVSLGPVLAIENLWQRIGIQETLKKIANKKRTGDLYERALFSMCANRLCEPESKLGVCVDCRVALPGDPPAKWLSR